MKITHASTFSGIGAPEIAAEMLGRDNLFHCEINPFGRHVLDYHFPKAKSYGDITQTDFSEWRGRVTVLTGGFPCQPFSYAGKRRGSEDGYLWPYMLKCIEQIKPSWFVGENVAGIGTMVFPGEDVKVGSQTDLFGEGDDIYERREKYVLYEIIENLENIGYDVQTFVIPACAVGTSHRRDRIFIVAHPAESFADDRAHEWFTDSWRAFPSIPAVHRGNDGIPFPLDGLTISFAKWKREPLKAYGNAIVPQIMFEIFRAIDKVERCYDK